MDVGRCGALFMGHLEGIRHMRLNVTKKLIQSHLAEGEMLPGKEIGIRIDQTLTQDATGTLVMLELEAMGLHRVRTEVVQ
jgi:homoaconitase/3-isopropylmalate dehydratase large subunit